jgi:hypothetical protein
VLTFFCQAIALNAICDLTTHYRFDIFQSLRLQGNIEATTLHIQINTKLLNSSPLQRYEQYFVSKF